MDINCNVMLGNWTTQASQIKTELQNFIKKHNKKTPAPFQTNPDNYFNNTRLWEYSMAIGHTASPSFSRDFKVLDFGGTNSILSWFLASKGINVTSIDLFAMHKERGEKNDSYFKLPNIKHLCGHLLDQLYYEEFDFVYSICVFEHIMELKRMQREEFKEYWSKGYEANPIEIKEEQDIIKHHANSLKLGGILALSYDYACTGGKLCNKHAAVIRNKQDIEDRIVKVSGLKLFGNPINTSKINGDHCIGIVFLRKE